MQVQIFTYPPLEHLSSLLGSDSFFFFSDSREGSIKVLSFIIMSISIKGFTRKNMIKKINKKSHYHSLCGHKAILKLS